MPSSCAVSTVQVHPLEGGPAPLTGEEMMAANPYRPWPARITSIIDVTATEKLFEFRLIDDRIRDAFSHEPGQFVEVSIFGVGEAPISISFLNDTPATKIYTRSRVGSVRCGCP